MKENILVIEDDESINNLIYKILIKQGYNVRQAFSGTEGKMILNMYNFQLVLLDLMLPGMTGEEIIGNIRETKNMPIIVISAKTALDDKVNVLKMGADDFVSKPFDIKEILARVEAQLRRYTKFSIGENSKKVLKYKELVLDKEQIEVRVKNERITLTGKEFSILELLMSNPKKVFTRENLFEHVWNDDFFGDDNTVNVHVSNLRSKISSIDKDNEYIKTVWGIGFKLAD
ncbi:MULTISPECIES: response regulator transcription factor [Clostridium]|uniref:response regulator transcription factor n=1 Tax=Clostridium TaxID=1485 RepID=UPI000C079E8D|nr:MULTISPECIES: response regulator transcription factor [Clostridium]MDB2118347.1 response regulator transcription factor [Clostridium paraputrificum]MDU3409882.1 response regulator transcription factor [Clostridium sp.]